MVFQKPNPFPKSIYDNVAWAPRNLGMKDKLDERVEQALRQAALWDEVKDRLRDSALGLSGGQQQRLCIARAIAIEPDVLLLDEPASALDPVATASIEDLMHNLKQPLTIVIVTHNMQQAARVADRTAFFSLDTTGPARVGTLIEYGDTADDLPQRRRPPHARLRRGPVRLIARAPAVRPRAPRAQRKIESLETCCRIGWPHCQQYDAPVLCGAAHDAQTPAVALCSSRRIRSISDSSESASWSRAARLTSTSTWIWSRIAIS